MEQGASEVVNVEEALHAEVFPLQAVCTWYSYVVPDKSPVNDLLADAEDAEVHEELPLMRY